jgi:hypothetical protein
MNKPATRGNDTTSNFIRLSPRRQREVLDKGATQSHLSPQLVEKDVWVCWALDAVFRVPDPYDMAFKGGTSLSKGYDAIRRLSEDVDITLDYKSLDPTVDPFDPDLSRTKQKKFSDSLKAKVQTYLVNTMVPWLESRLAADGLEQHTVNVEAGEGALRVNYPSRADRHQYVTESVLLEFGGRNRTEPHKVMRIGADLSPLFPNITFPAAEVPVLAGERTFWEKATLIHAACIRESIKDDPQRQARHWYDLAMLADHALGSGALKDRALLEDVVAIKQQFYAYSKFNYDQCLSREWTLIPGKDQLALLKADFDAMEAAGLLSQNPLPFADVVTRLQVLESELNA